MFHWNVIIAASILAVNAEFPFESVTSPSRRYLIPFDKNNFTKSTNPLKVRGTPSVVSVVNMFTVGRHRGFISAKAFASWRKYSSLVSFSSFIFWRSSSFKESQTFGELTVKICHIFVTWKIKYVYLNIPSQWELPLFFH